MVIPQQVDAERARRDSQMLRSALLFYSMLLYGDFVKTMSARFDGVLSEIWTEYNFDYGPEFEIALCSTLRRVLPQRFGICRGFVVNRDGDTAGDDIIIYDRHLYPTLRALDQDTFVQKEKVPIEAVYAYIEAKHTLNLFGEGDSSLAKAQRQVAAVKSLCAQRDPIGQQGVVRGARAAEPWAPVTARGWPEIRNPLYGAVMSRYVRLIADGPAETDWSAIHDRFAGLKRSSPVDFIALGQSNVALSHTLDSDNEPAVYAPFRCARQAVESISWIPDMAFGVALCHLLWALDSIELGMMQWGDLVFNAINSVQPPSDAILVTRVVS